MAAHEPSALLHTVEIIHWAALGVMAIVYTLRIRWLLAFKAPKERQAPGQPGRTNAQRGGMYSLANVMMPWAMESTRRGFPFYLTFVIFHLGVVAGIALAFLSTVAAGMFRVAAVEWTFAGFLGAAFLVALYRVGRRFGRSVMRLISTPDDYFSLLMLTIWFGNALLALFHVSGRLPNETALIAYLLLTSFFLLYVPFSKISHYLYYPFTRYWLGRSLGHRGVMPLVRG